jgi:mycothiol system anti-sigma-R factor
MKPSCREFDALVTPYVDGEATASERALVEAHLAKCPPCRQRAEAETAVRQTVRTRLCRPCAPEHLRARCLAAAALEKGSGILTWTAGSLRTFSIAAAMIVIIGGVLLYALTRVSPTVLAAQLALDHLKCFAVDRPTSPVDPTASEQSFERDHGWQVRVPRAAVAGLELVGIRQCFCAQGGANAHVMYLYNGQPVSLYIMPGVDRERASTDVFGHDAVIWSKGGNTYVLLGREPDATLQKLSADLSQGL